jgi:ribulose kinase
LEAIAYGVRDLVNTAKGNGVVPRRFVTSGGSTQNLAFVKVLAAVLDTPIEIGKAEAGLVGAAMAAALYSGWYATLEEAMAAMTSEHAVVQPDPEAVRYYGQPVS